METKYIGCVFNKPTEGMLAYELLAEKDPAFKAILDEFKELGGTVGTAE